MNMGCMNEVQTYCTTHPLCCYHHKTYQLYHLHSQILSYGLMGL